MGDLTAANGGSTTGGSAFDIDLSSVANNNKVTIASNVDGGTRTLRGTSPQRVLSITGGANLVFENIDITGGDTSGNGGGIYVAGNSKVNFSGNITGNTARSGGGVYLEAGTGPSDFSSFTLTSGSAIANNTAFGTGVPASAFNVSAMEGGGGVYIKGNATFTLASGTISGNTTKGSGGGVLVNGNVDGGTEYGLLMPTGGEITGNRSTGDDYPHGGGGVYVAQGGFTMAGGKITGNTATRQGGGVFVHWANSSTLTARFTASGDSVITGNKGVGSSKAICNRGITELKGNTEADFVYIWDYDTAALPQSFSLADHVQVTTGIAFARANTASPNKNFIQLMTGYDQTGIGENKQIVIDLESHLEGGNYAGTLVDWIGQTVITGAHNILEDMNNNNRFILGTFKGATTVSGLSNNYKIDVDDTKGKFVTK
jgi:hypothetical protein